MNTFEQLPLWKRFEKVSDAKQIANIQELLEWASSMLDRIVETFPTYTLHNSIHATNVARLMGELLGKAGLQKITSLEAAMLLLSAYYHDIGMLFRKGELEELAKEPDWEEFLQRNPEAFVKVKKSKLGIPIDIAEWYCRCRHADRVFHYLNEVPGKLLNWGAVPVTNDLGSVCRSHNLPATDLFQLDTDYLGECDLRFCGILLRLADILDFDSSRAPESVYSFL